jgi:hypothetical protein
MFTAAHSWLSRRFSIQEWAAVNIEYNTQNEDKQIHNTNIENRQDNQEWAAASIGYNTQNEEKQNT